MRLTREDRDRTVLHLRALARDVEAERDTQPRSTPEWAAYQAIAQGLYEQAAKTQDMGRTRQPRRKV